MNRSFVPCLLFTLCLASGALAQTGRPATPADSSSPAWLPRGAFLGTSIRDGAVMPQARLQWQFVFFKSRTDTLGVLVEPIGSFALIKPDTVVEGADVDLTQLQLYSLMFAAGYTSRRGRGLEWGFQLGTGPAWFRARFRNAPRAEESYWGGLLDGRARIGYRFSSVSLGLAVGYGDPYNYRRASLARSYIGGLQLGFYADWR
jgi:hypothetical protein